MSVIYDFRGHVLHRPGKSTDAVADASQTTRSAEIRDLYGAIVAENVKETWNDFSTTQFKRINV